MALGALDAGRRIRSASVVPLAICGNFTSDTRLSKTKWSAVQLQLTYTPPVNWIRVETLLKFKLDFKLPETGVGSADALVQRPQVACRIDTAQVDLTAQF